MVKRLSSGVYTGLFGVLHLALTVNLALGITCLPFLVLLVTTDPSLSWPALAVAAVLSGPGIAASFATFRAHARGENAILRSFARGLAASWRSALRISTIVGAVVLVAVGDIFALASTPVAPVVAPVLAVIALLALAVGMLGLVLVGEIPDARMRDVLRASTVLAVRRWPLTLASFAVIAVQAAAVTVAPAIAIGLTAAPCLYIVWAGGRYALQAVRESAAQKAAP